jgi:hypothetical protein
MLPRLFSILSVVLLSIGPAHGDQSLEPHAEEARAAIKTFAGTLMSTLTEAMQESGPVNAIAVCKVDAPRIAAEVGQSSSWAVARTSLKVRNPDNAPDLWEREVLESFAERMSAGENPAMIEHIERIEGDGGAFIRYMKAIPTAEPCITCHGANLQPELAARIDELYPADQARGFEVGELRGAFTLSKPVAE